MKKLELTEEQLEKLTEFNNVDSHNSYSFVILMRSPEGNLEFHERPREPCYGGLRRYKSEPGNENLATEDDRKPGDLRHTFPQGEPEGVCVRLSHLRQMGDRQYEQSKKMLDFVFSSDSPWIRGFGSPENVQFTFNKENKITGYILLSSDVDPTVMVNLFRFIINSPKLEDNYTRKSILSNLVGCPYVSVSTAGKKNISYFGHRMSLERIFSGNPHETVKGTWREGYDYSRKLVDHIWYEDMIDSKKLSSLAVLKERLEARLEEFKAVHIETHYGFYWKIENPNHLVTIYEEELDKLLKDVA